jgi:hypothetical protein
MVGQKPPLPRTYPAFRFASVLATLLLFFAFATNFIAPRLVRTAAPLAAYGMGGGGGGAPETEFQSATAEAAQPALELPAEEPAPPGTPTPLATLVAPAAEDNFGVEPTVQPSEKSGVQEIPTSDTFGQRILAEEDEQPRMPAPLVGAPVQILLGVVALLSGLVALILRYTAIRTWRARAK